ncbi:MAG TPA: rod-binding protein [Limnochordales bacterium]|nr:rod-binding protein [Limnochordales bacterium]
MTEALRGTAGGAGLAAGQGAGPTRKANPAGGFQAALDAAVAAETGSGAAPVRPVAGPSRGAAGPAVPRGASGGSGFAFTPSWDLPSSSAGDEARLRWASEQLEALFLEMLWRGMRRTVMSTGMLDGPGVRLFEEMLDQERARMMAAAGTLGLAEMVYQEMSRHLPGSGDGRTTAGGREDM